MGLLGTRNQIGLSDLGKGGETCLNSENLRKTSTPLFMWQDMAILEPWAMSSPSAQLESQFQHAKECFEQGMSYDETLQAFTEDAIPLDL